MYRLQNISGNSRKTIIRIKKISHQKYYLIVLLINFKITQMILLSLIITDKLHSFKKTIHFVCFLIKKIMVVNNKSNDTNYP